MTLLQIIQAVVGEVGLTPVTYVIGNTDQAVVQYLALANQVGNQLITEGEWQKSNKTHTFTVQTDSQNGTITSGSAVITGLTDTSSIVADTWQVTGSGIPTDTYVASVDSATQITMNQAATESGTYELTFTQTAYAFPADWNYQINRTHWDRSNQWEMVGPKSAQEWEWMKSGIVATGPRIRYRLLNNKFQIWPIATTASLLAYEYMSTSWIYDTAADSEPSVSLFDADDNTTIFRDRLMIAGIKLRLFEVKGFDATAFQREYSNELDKALAMDQGAPTLTLAPVYTNFLLSAGNVQDGNFPS